MNRNIFIKNNGLEFKIVFTLGILFVLTGIVLKVFF